MITKNKFVSVAYELRTEPHGEALEQASREEPLTFICGQGQTLEYFEMNLLEKNKGEKFDFKIAVANAYGTAEEDMVVDLPRDIFKEVAPEAMCVGETLPMMDSIGRRLQGRIVEVGEHEVRIDFNHPLAGKELYFTGEVLDVRDATDEELEAALHEHKCGGCGGSCGTEGGCGSHDHEHGGCSGGCCH